MAIKTHESGAQVIRASSVIHWGEILARQRSRQVHCFSFNSDEVMGLLVLGSWKLRNQSENLATTQRKHEPALHSVFS